MTPDVIVGVLAEHKAVSAPFQGVLTDCACGQSVPHHRAHVAAVLAAAEPAHAAAPTDAEAGCHCPPCPGRGYDGHGMNHCAECCFGSGVEADPDCPTHGRAALTPADHDRRNT